MNFSFKSISSLFSKKQHKYKTQDDLINLSAPEIITLEPNDVSSKIDKAPSKHKLEGAKNRAMNKLLAIKRFEKKHPNIKGRQAVIKSFLQEEGYDKEVNDKLLEIYKKDVLSRIEMKDLENRLRDLDNRSRIEYTESEKIFKQMREQSKSMKSKSKGGKTMKKNKQKNNKTRNR
jgi:hypothetical protein